MDQSKVWYIAAVLFLVAAVASFIGGQSVFGGAFIAIGAMCVDLGYIEARKGGRT